jgi:hypothetical protein
MATISLWPQGNRLRLGTHSDQFVRSIPAQIRYQARRRDWWSRAFRIELESGADPTTNLKQVQQSRPGTANRGLKTVSYRSLRPPVYHGGGRGFSRLIWVALRAKCCDGYFLQPRPIAPDADIAHNRSGAIAGSARARFDNFNETAAAAYRARRCNVGFRHETEPAMPAALSVHTSDIR